MEKVESFKFLGVHITDNLKWSTHTDNVVKKVQQHLFNLRRLKKFGLAPDVTGRPKRSSRKTTTQTTACSPHYPPEVEVSTVATKLRPRY